MTSYHVSPLEHFAQRHAPEPGSAEAFALSIIEGLTGLSDQLRQTVADRAWSEITSVVQESGYLPAAADGATLDVAPNFSDLVQITHVIVAVPTGATGTLTIGRDFILPNLPAGVTPLRVRKLVAAGDVRRLTISGGAGGPAALILQGSQTAPTGSMAP